jgi:hypothetical protein
VKKLELEGIRPVAPGIYINTNPVPRAMLVNEYTILSDEKDRLERIKDPGWNPTKSAIVEEKHKGLDNIKPAENGGKVEIIDYRPNKIVMKTKSDNSSIMVLNEPFAPGWQATIDGQKRPLFPVNQVQRGLIVEYGDHTVTFSYTPAILMLGLCLTLISLVIVIGIMIIGCQKY